MPEKASQLTPDETSKPTTIPGGVPPAPGNTIDFLIEMATKKTQAAAQPKPVPVKEAARVALAEPPKQSGGWAQKLGKLRPLLPIVSGGLRMVDHGAVQALAQILTLAGGGATAAGASPAAVEALHEELQQGLAEIQTGHRQLHLQVQDQTVELRRVEDQITMLRQSVERSATEHAELVADVKSLGNLVRTIGAGLAILLVVLISLTILLLTRHHG